jgi:hypothetical protein
VDQPGHHGTQAHAAAAAGKLHQLLLASTGFQLHLVGQGVEQRFKSLLVFAMVARHPIMIPVYALMHSPVKVPITLTDAFVCVMYDPLSHVGLRHGVFMALA